MVTHQGKENNYCIACGSSECSCHEVLEEQIFAPAKAFVIVEQGNELPQGVQLATQYNDPHLYGAFRDHFLESEGSEAIIISSRKDLDEYVMEQDPCYQPIKPDFSSVKAMKRKGIRWEKGDYVFVVWSVKHRWQIKGGPYRP